jgi:endo-1,4-beta-D-glucanase Y
MRKVANIIIFILLWLTAAHAAPKYPFPQNVKYKFGTQPQVSPEVMAADVQAAYDDWLARYVTSEGCPQGAYRVHRYYAYDCDTVSEGIGFGMLITVLLDNDRNQSQKYFDGFWRYYQSHLNGRGLMAWKIDRAGSVLDRESATEADENVAMALLFAHKQWGSAGPLDYGAAGRELLARIMSYEVWTANQDYVVKPGAGWGGKDIVNPAYFAPAYYRIWRNYDWRWLKVANRAYKLYEVFYKRYQTGLYPDWCVPEGSTSYLGYNFTYDACRVPLNIALDYLWHGAGNKYLYRLNSWIAGQTGGRPDLIVDGYKLDGTPLGKHNSAAFVGPLAVAAMISPKYHVWLDALYQQLVQTETNGNWGYYPDTLRLVSLLVLSGNMPNLWEVKPRLDNSQLPRSFIPESLPH